MKPIQRAVKILNCTEPWHSYCRCVQGMPPNSGSSRPARIAPVCPPDGKRGRAGLFRDTCPAIREAGGRVQGLVELCGLEQLRRRTGWLAFHREVEVPGEHADQVEDTELAQAPAKTDDGTHDPAFLEACRAR